MDIVSISLSLIVAIVAGFSAYVSYLNFQSVTRVTLYLYADTISNSMDQRNYNHYPFRVQNAVLLNHGNLPPSNPIVIRWFDFSLGNTGPGVAYILSWKIKYDVKAKDAADMKSNEPFYLGPQAKIPIVGYLPRDYSLDSRGQFFSQFTKVNTDDGKFPWKLIVTYEKQKRFNKHAKFGLEFEVNHSGRVKTTEIFDFDEEK